MIRAFSNPTVLLVIGSIWLTCGVGWFLLSKGQGERIYEKVDRLLTREEFFSRRTEQIFEDMLRKGEDEVAQMKGLREEVSTQLHEMAALDARMREEEKAKLTDDLVRLLEFQERQRKEGQQDLRREIKKLSGDVATKLDRVQILQQQMAKRRDIGIAGRHQHDEVAGREVPGVRLGSLDKTSNVTLYTNTKQCLEWLGGATLHRPQPYKRIDFHTYWPHIRTNAEMERRVRGLKSFFATQELSHYRLHLWTQDVLLQHDQTALSPLRPFMHVHMLDLYELIRDTALQFDYKEINLLRSAELIDNGDYFDILKLLILHKFGGLWFDIDALFLRDLTPLLPVGGTRERPMKGTLANLEFFTLPHIDKNGVDSGCGSAFYLKRGSNAAEQMMAEMQALIRQHPDDTDDGDEETYQSNGPQKPMLDLACAKVLELASPSAKTPERLTKVVYPSCFVAEASHEQVLGKAREFALSSFAVLFPKRSQDSADPTSTTMSEAEIELEEKTTVAFIEYSDFAEWRFAQLVRNGQIPLATPIDADEDEIEDDSCVSALDERYPVRYVSMSVFGEKPFYLAGLLENADLLPHVYPGWKLRVYVGCNFSADMTQKITDKGVEVVSDHELCGDVTLGPLWRFLIYDDPQVDAFIVRDSDSRFGLREQTAVRAWLESPYGLHMMRDHPQHGAPMMAGMWGAKRNSIPIDSMIEELRNYQLTGSRDDDQIFLNTAVYEKAKDQLLSHDSYFCNDYPNSAKELPETPPKCRGRPEWTLG